MSWWLSSKSDVIHARSNGSLISPVHWNASCVPKDDEKTWVEISGRSSAVTRTFLCSLIDLVIQSIPITNLEVNHAGYHPL